MPIGTSLELVPVSPSTNDLLRFYDLDKVCHLRRLALENMQEDNRNCVFCSAAECQGTGIRQTGKKYLFAISAKNVAATIAI